MSKKVVAATFLAKPETKETLQALILKTADFSRQEKGVEKYLVNVIDQDLGYFLLVGVYSSQEAFDLHVNSDHVQKFLAAVPNLVTENLTYVSTPLDSESNPKARINS